MRKSAIMMVGVYAEAQPWKCSTPCCTALSRWVLMQPRQLHPPAYTARQWPWL